MKKNYTGISLWGCFLLFFTVHSFAQTKTVGLFTHLSGSEDDGYVLFAPVDNCDTTYLIDKCGREVHKWAASYRPGLDVYLLPDGTLLRTGWYPNPVFDPSDVSSGGIIQRFDWDSHLLWQYLISSPMETQDHDIYPLPNGNILAAIWEVISDSEAIANGRNPSLLGAGLWSAKVEEIQPVGTDSANIVWTWRLWDHLIQDYDSTKPNYGVVADHPELFNLNYVNTAADAATNPDWIHLNQVTYNPTFNQVMISGHNVDEIWIIDHSTDSATAAGHTGGTYNKGGDFLYRWGNPGAYNRGTTADIKLWEQHDPTWITTGKYTNQIMIFNNGLGRPGGNASSIDIINPPVDPSGNYTLAAGAAYGPDTLTWTYEAPVPGSFYSMYMGGAQTLTNGDILVCNAEIGQFFEIDSSKNIVWNYINPVNDGYPAHQGTPVGLTTVYRCTFYPFSYSGFSGDTIPVSVFPIELDPLPDTCSITYLNTPLLSGKITTEIFPNPANTSITIQSNSLNSITLTNIIGQTVITKHYDNAGYAELNTTSLPGGIYILCINGSQYQQIIIQH